MPELLLPEPDASEEPEEVPTIEIAGDPPSATDGPVRVVVADDEPGIPETEVEMLRNDAETQLEHSTGLGL